ncbi:MAG: sigma-70 family RNA polymerase sigma factor [Eubacterium sp.]|nr:sigma-70 family RNA polymerase sigma factor [Eubacterium sp.]
MIDFLESYYYASPEASENSDRQRAKRKGFSQIIPLLFENELTEKQSMCLKYKYLYGKSQNEIAKTLKLSQPTVSRHIRAGKEAVNSKLTYCWAAMTAALNEYDKLN